MFRYELLGVAKTLDVGFLKIYMTGKKERFCVYLWRYTRAGKEITGCCVLVNDGASNLI